MPALALTSASTSAQMASRPDVTREQLVRELNSFEAEYSAAPTGGAVKWQLLGEVRRLFDGLVSQVSTPHTEWPHESTSCWAVLA